jgi:hypothetical protein
MPTFDTPGPISVTVELGVGDLRVGASDRTDTVVEVRPSDPTKKDDVTAAEQTRVEYADGRLLIKAPRGGWRQYTFRGGGESIDVQVDLPAGSHLRGDAGVAALHCRGRLGECRYRTGVGEIQLDQVGPVQLKTGAGDITVHRAVGDADVAGSGAVRIDSVEGTAVVKNSNGDTWIGEVTGDLKVSAANGAISVDRARGTVGVKTANGNVRVGEVTRGAVVAQTAFGKVEIGVLDGVAAWLDLNTKYGSVQNDLDAAEQPAPGEKAVEVRARTSFGDITIHRSFASDISKEDA